MARLGTRGCPRPFLCVSPTAPLLSRADARRRSTAPPTASARRIPLRSLSSSDQLVMDQRGLSREWRPGGRLCFPFPRRCWRIARQNTPTAMPPGAQCELERPSPFLYMCPPLHSFHLSPRLTVRLLSAAAKQPAAAGAFAAFLTRACAGAFACKTICACAKYCV